MVWASITEQHLLPFTDQIDENYLTTSLGKIGESLANHACNVLNSADNITVTIILLRHSATSSISRRNSNPTLVSTSAISYLSSQTTATTTPQISPFNQNNDSVFELISTNNNSSINKSNNPYSSNYRDRTTTSTTTTSTASLSSTSATSSQRNENITNEKRKNESEVSEDDLMRFLLDDSNF